MLITRSGDDITGYVFYSSRKRQKKAVPTEIADRRL